MSGSSAGVPVLRESVRATTMSREEVKTEIRLKSISRQEPDKKNPARGLARMRERPENETDEEKILRIFRRD